MAWNLERRALASALRSGDTWESARTVSVKGYLGMAEIRGAGIESCRQPLFTKQWLFGNSFECFGMIVLEF